MVLEPDGKGSHWFRVDVSLCETAGINANAIVTMTVEPSQEWPEPEVPADLNKALASDPKANDLWTKIIPMAPMDTRYQQRKNTQPTHRSSVIEDPGGRTKTML
jgi:hypothetical protein